MILRRNRGYLMHTIRLRGLWQCTPMATTYWTSAGKSEETGTDVPAPGTIKVPGNWDSVVGSQFRGKVLLQRYFHKPTGLEENDVVQIRIEGINALAEVFVNHEAYGSLTVDREGCVFDVSDSLELRNLLELVVDFPMLDEHSAELNTLPDAGGGILGEVQLEIVPAS